MVLLAYGMVVLPFALAWDISLMEGQFATGTWAAIIFWSLDLLLA